MKVFHVISTLSTGGAESALARIVESSAEAVEHRVATLRSYGDTAERLARAGIWVQDMGMRPAVPGPFGFARLARSIRAFRPDVVQTWMYHADLAGSLANLVAGRHPVVWNIRHSDFGDASLKPTTRWTVRACSWLAPRIPARIICCSREAARLHAAAGYPAERLVFIPNGFDSSAFRPDAAAADALRTELAVPPSVRLVGLVARFHPQKDHRTFVEAARRIVARKEDVRFLLCGEGVTAGAAIGQWIEEAGLSDRFYLLGRRGDVPRIMAALDVYVSSSAYGEGFPNVIGEAMAAAVPPVATDVGDSRYLIGDAGAVVPARDAKRLADAILAMLDLPDDERRRRGEAARERVVRQFAIASVADQYIDVWNEVADVARAEPEVKPEETAWR